MTTETEAEAIAQDILAAAPFDPRAPENGRDLAAAYAVQDALAARLEAALGAVAGWKIAVNAPALMAHFGVTEPASGRVFAQLRQDAPARRKASDFRDFAYEPEIAAVMDRTLSPQAAPFTRDDVAGAVARFVPALELLDLRGATMPTMHLPDVVAQNITNAGAVIGGPGIAPDALDPAQLHTRVQVNGAEALSVTGGAPQHPLDAVTWLANHLAGRGLSLEAGQIVLCGTHAPIAPVSGPAEIVVEMSGLGAASLVLE
ncbi:MAG: 2-keto-4-pentenoate hydratase [Paracoccaceae bacterium]